MQSLYYFFVCCLPRGSVIYLPLRKQGNDPSSARKALSYGEKIAKIGPVRRDIRRNTLNHVNTQRNFHLLACSPLKLLNIKVRVPWTYSSNGAEENMNTDRNVLPYPQNALHFEAGVWLKYILILLKQFFPCILR